MSYLGMYVLKINHAQIKKDLLAIILLRRQISGASSSTPLMLIIGKVSVNQEVKCKKATDVITFGHRLGQQN